LEKIENMAAGQASEDGDNERTQKKIAALEVDVEEKVRQIATLKGLLHDAKAYSSRRDEEVILLRAQSTRQAHIIMAYEQILSQVYQQQPHILDDLTFLDNNSLFAIHALKAQMADAPVLRGEGKEISNHPKMVQQCNSTMCVCAGASESNCSTDVGSLQIVDKPGSAASSPCDFQGASSQKVGTIDSCTPTLAQNVAVSKGPAPACNRVPGALEPNGSRTPPSKAQSSTCAAGSSYISAVPIACADYSQIPLSALKCSAAEAASQEAWCRESDSVCSSFQGQSEAWSAPALDLQRSPDQGASPPHSAVVRPGLSNLSSPNPESFTRGTNMLCHSAKEHPRAVQKQVLSAPSSLAFLQSLGSNTCKGCPKLELPSTGDCRVREDGNTDRGKTMCNARTMGSLSHLSVQKFDSVVQVKEAVHYDGTQPEWFLVSGLQAVPPSPHVMRK